MKKILIKHGKWLGYLLYTVVLVTALLYCRFPSDTIRTYLESRVAAEAPGWALSVEGVSPGIPPGLDMTNVSVWSRETPQKHALQAKRIAVSPAFGAFVSGAAEYRFNAHAYNGDITGRIRFEQNDMTGPFSASVQLKGLHVGLHPYLPPLAGRDVSGILGGDISFSGTQRRLLDGAGKGIITISDGSVKLLQPVMGLEAVDFDRLSLKMALKNRQVTLSRVELEGKTLKGELSGTIALNRDFSRSRLNLKGTMEPLGGLLGKMGGNAATLRFLRQGLKKLNRDFVIQGTFGKPVFRFL